MSPRVDRVESLTDQPHDPDQITDAPFQVGESIPSCLTATDMCRAFRFTTKSGFYRAERKGQFVQFELRRTGGPKRWNGVLVQRHLNGYPGLVASRKR